MSDARTTYEERLRARRDEVAARERADRWIADARLAVVALAGAGAYLAFGPDLLSPGWLALPGLAFLVLVVAHELVLRRKARAALGARFYERGLERLAGRWQAGAGGERFADAEHPYAQDLDVFGPGSLFTLLCTVQTPAGEETLAAWLAKPAARDEVMARQAAVRELAPRLELREQLYTLAAEVRFGIRPAVLTRWGEGQRLLERRLAWVVSVVALLVPASVVAWGLGLGLAPLLVAVPLVWLTTRLLRARVESVLAFAEEASRDLAVLGKLTARLEREPVTAPKLAALAGVLVSGGATASRQIRRLGRLVELADARRNQMFAVIAYLVLWAPVWALAVERWRERHGRALRGWLAAVGELEALGAFAAQAFEHPGDCFAEIEGEGPLYEARGLAHPFLGAGEAVRNDVKLDATLRLLVVSGSNMSGKSTLLRSVGVSIILGLAGAPVRATRLRLSPLALGASLRVSDSLHAHTSRFYAEVKRLEQVVSMASAGRPVLFLLDEILHGTNSHDRREGARAVLVALIDRGAVGLVTTHDLALASLADELGARAANVHFVDHLEGGRLVFDYRLRPGVVTKSNAIALMRAVGLPV